MIPQVLTGLNLFLDGTTFAGVAKEVTLPPLKMKTEDYVAGGMGGVIKMPMGMEAMDGAFTLYGISPEALKHFGIADATAFNGVFRGAYSNQKGDTVSAIVTFRGLLSEVDLGSWKPQESAEAKFNISLSYYRLEVDSQVIYEIDPVGCIRIINGKDELAAARTALGM